MTTPVNVLYCYCHCLIWPASGFIYLPISYVLLALLHWQVLSTYVSTRRQLDVGFRRAFEIAETSININATFQVPGMPALSALHALNDFVAGHDLLLDQTLCTIIHINP